MPSEALARHWIGHPCHVSQVRHMLRLALAGALLLTAPVHAQTVSAQAPGKPPAVAGASASANTINSVERADEVIRDVARQRTAIAEQYRNDQQACATVFLMTRCLDAARERRRAALGNLREPEIEANAFKRRARVAERDQALEEKRLQSERAATAEQQGITLREPGKAAASGRDAAAETNPRAARPALVVRPERELPQRAPKPLSAPISAANEAKNRASFDRKSAESAERQRVIAEKKAEKEKDRTARKAREAAVTPPAVEAP